MKKFLPAIALLGLLQIATPGQAQVRVQVNVGMQPQWGPSGYDYANYYYLPDIDVYYNVPRRQFVYLNRGRWEFAASLPAYYRSFDLYSSYKVVINDDAPYMRCDYYRGQYGRYRGYHGRQMVIRDAPRYRYDRRPEQHNRYDRDERYGRDDRRGHDDRHDNGRHNGHGDRKHRH